MTAHSRVPAREPDPWAELRAEADAGDDRLWDSLASGRYDAERLLRSWAGLTMLAGLPPLARPAPAEARCPADAAVALLVGDFLAG